MGLSFLFYYIQGCISVLGGQTMRRRWGGERRKRKREGRRRNHTPRISPLFLFSQPSKRADASRPTSRPKGHCLRLSERLRGFDNTHLKHVLSHNYGMHLKSKLCRSDYRRAFSFRGESFLFRPFLSTWERRNGTSSRKSIRPEERKKKILSATRFSHKMEKRSRSLSIWDCSISVHSQMGVPVVVCTVLS